MFKMFAECVVGGAAGLFQRETCCSYVQLTNEASLTERCLLRPGSGMWKSLAQAYVMSFSAFSVFPAFIADVISMQPGTQSFSRRLNRNFAKILGQFMALFLIRYFNLGLKQLVHALIILIGVKFVRGSG